MQTETAGELEKRAAAGDGHAQAALARALDAQGRHGEARAWLEKGAKAQDVAALTALGQHLMIHSPLSVYDGLRATIAAAQRGGAEACHFVAVLSAAGSGLPQNWAAAFEYLERSAEFGWELARRELALLAGDRVLAAQASRNDAPADIWKRLRETIDVAAPTSVPPVHVQSQAPRIHIFERLLSPAVCDWLIERARPKMEPARVYDRQSGGGLIQTARTNSATDFNIVEIDVVIALVRAKMASATGLAPAMMEHTAVLHYAIGQQFMRHFDFLDPEIPAYAQDIAQRGQRVATVLIYLNEEFAGAETEFPLLNWKYRGGKGDAIAFWNVEPSGVPDRRTFHAGLAPVSGEKWLLSQFIRGAVQARAAQG